MKISISAKDRYVQCPRSYQLHYIKKIRSIRQSSALVFGSCLDDALNALLTDRDVVAATQVFVSKWAEYADKPVIDYFKSDLDMTLISEEDCAAIDALPEELREHTANHISLMQKGLKLIELYNKEILPKILKVVEVQKNISIKNATEDEIVGIIDLVAEIEHDGKVVVAVLDNKSTSSPYPKNSVAKKQQTALYTYAEGIEYAGFLTLNKKTFKHQIIIDKVPEELQDSTINEFVGVLDLIKAEKFDKIEKKDCFGFGKRCDYYGLCWNNKMDGLSQKE